MAQRNNSSTLLKATFVLVVLVAVAWPSQSEAQTTTLSPYLAYILRINYPTSILYRLPARDLNGIALNRALPDGRHIEKISLDNVRVWGWHWRRYHRSLNLNGTYFWGHRYLPGAVFTATLDDGSQTEVRIDNYKKQHSRRPKSVQSYYVSYKTDNGWAPLCGRDKFGIPISAIPLLGYWDYSQGTETGGSKTEDNRYFTFACEGHVIHKCVEAGYKPWESVGVCYVEGGCEKVSLSDYHQACTRMMRADFCGNGNSHTQDDITVALYDGLDIRYDTEEWGFEAEWDADGAVCATSGRLSEAGPVCMQYLEDETCGDKSHFEDSVLIMSELPSQ